MQPHGMSIHDVRAAAERIGSRVWRTPVVRCPALDALADCELWLKAENLQRIGAFKARGAVHAVGRLDPAARARGIITYSSGNHAQAVALAAREYQASATIAMPTDAPAIKVAAVRELGATIVFAGTTSQERKAAALQLQAETGGTIIEPFDAPEIVAGAGTATLELVEEVRARTGGGTLDALLVPVGGGGLIAGACLVCAAEGITVHSVEPEGCDALARSIEQDERVVVTPGPTLADGLKPVQIGALNFAIARSHVRTSHRVDDTEIGHALVRLLLRAKLLVEPSGAAALAVALRGRLEGAPKRVGVLLSGGNVDPSRIESLVRRHGANA